MYTSESLKIETNEGAKFDICPSVFQVNRVILLAQTK